MLEQLVEQLADGAGLLGGAVGLFDLPEDLRFAQHQGVEAAGDAQDVAHRLTVGVGIDVGRDLLCAEAVEVLEPLHHRRLVFALQPAIDLGAVAGGEDGRLLYHARCGQLLQGLRHRLRGERHPFPYLYGGGAVVQAKGEQCHVSVAGHGQGSQFCGTEANNIKYMVSVYGFRGSGKNGETRV